ncbi:MAG: hypothetical protein A2591_02775 [Candidatus Yonathbacteria bacterium RIFOXYD1_FULL_52_36]|uniref:Uncharacterized protein n=1 Tax=Candidatus Yonathbacteria bacterium RIFOXYD1_FULL_52_36 TaxID=1802730 RepID=A0A1G2SLC8_9BACT|nr:MAG: hypothetical protein A2591_02775 [Candidatus Yonathbacteria bacterium RIFOXYD1_FULL_52_36]
MVFDLLMFCAAGYVIVGVLFAIPYTIRLIQYYPHDFGYGVGRWYAFASGATMVVAWGNILYHAIPSAAKMTVRNLREFRRTSVDQ